MGTRERTGYIGRKRLLGRGGLAILIARVIDDSINGHYYVTLSDSSNHDITFFGGAWRSSDSSYMVCDPAALRLTLKGGLNIRFNYTDPGEPTSQYATRVQDTSGNYLDIAYQGSGGRISNIQDTLGNTYTFVLNPNGNNRLQQIQYLNTNGTTSNVTFSHQAQTLSFGPQEPTDPGIASQYSPRSSIPTYLSSGEINEITYPTCGKSRYFYTARQVFDRLIRQNVYEHLVSSHDTGVADTWSWSGAPAPGQTAPTGVSITLPGGTVMTHSMNQASPGWADGFATFLSEGGMQQTNQGWTQDDINLTTILNPRLDYSEKVLKKTGQPDKVIRTGTRAESPKGSVYCRRVQTATQWITRAPAKVTRCRTGSGGGIQRTLPGATNVTFLTDFAVPVFVGRPRFPGWQLA